MTKTTSIKVAEVTREVPNPSYDGRNGFPTQNETVYDIVETTRFSTTKKLPEFLQLALKRNSQSELLSLFGILQRLTMVLVKSAASEMTFLEGRTFTGIMIPRFDCMPHGEKMQSFTRCTCGQLWNEHRFVDGACPTPPVKKDETISNLCSCS